MNYQMASEWVPLTELTSITSEGCRSKACFNANSGWFSGHFPNKAILPGVALLALAAQTAIENSKNKGRLLSLIGFKRVRFKKIITPGDELQVWVDDIPKETGRGVSFQIETNDELVCHGKLIFSEKEPPKTTSEIR